MHGGVIDVSDAMFVLQTKSNGINQMCALQERPAQVDLYDTSSVGCTSTAVHSREQTTTILTIFHYSCRKWVTHLTIYAFSFYAKRPLTNQSSKEDRIMTKERIIHNFGVNVTHVLQLLQAMKCERGNIFPIASYFILLFSIE